MRRFDIKAIEQFFRVDTYKLFKDIKSKFKRDKIVFVTEKGKETIYTQDTEFQAVPSGGKKGDILVARNDGRGEWSQAFVGNEEGYPAVAVPIDKILPGEEDQFISTKNGQVQWVNATIPVGKDNQILSANEGRLNWVNGGLVPEGKSGQVLTSLGGNSSQWKTVGEVPVTDDENKILQSAGSNVSRWVDGGLVPYGTRGQILQSTGDYDSEWITAHLVPTDGLNRQVLVSQGSNISSWETWGLVPRGVTGQFLQSSGDYESKWVTGNLLPNANKIDAFLKSTGEKSFEWVEGLLVPVSNSDGHVLVSVRNGEPIWSNRGFVPYGGSYNLNDAPKYLRFTGGFSSTWEQGGLVPTDGEAGQILCSNGGASSSWVTGGLVPLENNIPGKFLASAGGANSEWKTGGLVPLAGLTNMVLVKNSTGYEWDYIGKYLTQEPGEEGQVLTLNSEGDVEWGTGIPQGYPDQVLTTNNDGKLEWRYVEQFSSGTSNYISAFIRWYASFPPEMDLLEYAGYIPFLYFPLLNEKQVCKGLWCTIINSNDWYIYRKDTNELIEDPYAIIVWQSLSSGKFSYHSEFSYLYGYKNGTIQKLKISDLHKDSTDNNKIKIIFSMPYPFVPDAEVKGNAQDGSCKIYVFGDFSTKVPEGTKGQVLTSKGGYDVEWKDNTNSDQFSLPEGNDGDILMSTGGTDIEWKSRYTLSSPEEDAETKILLGYGADRVLCIDKNSSEATLIHTRGIPHFVLGTYGSKVILNLPLYVGKYILPYIGFSASVGDDDRIIRVPLSRWYSISPRIVTFTIALPQFMKQKIGTLSADIKNLPVKFILSCPKVYENNSYKTSVDFGEAIFNLKSPFNRPVVMEQLSRLSPSTVMFVADLLAENKVIYLIHDSEDIL